MRGLVCPGRVVLCVLCFLAGLGAAAAAGGAATCGGGVACILPNGRYHIVMPPGASAAHHVPAILFLHGHGAKGSDFSDDPNYRALTGELGVAFIAPDGENGRWALPSLKRSGRDEFAFLDSVVADATKRFPIDRWKIVVEGFSMGSSMAWYIACERGGEFAAFVTMAGAYWNGLPQDCKGPPPILLHIHGIDDPVVTMAGRQLGKVGHETGVLASLASVAERGGCSAPAAAPGLMPPLSCRVWSGCRRGWVALCLHEGGHEVRPEWVAEGWRIIADRLGWPIPVPAGERW